MRHHKRGKKHTHRRKRTKPIRDRNLGLDLVYGADELEIHPHAMNQWLRRRHEIGDPNLASQGQCKLAANELRDIARKGFRVRRIGGSVNQGLHYQYSADHFCYGGWVIVVSGGEIRTAYKRDPGKWAPIGT